MNAANTKIKFYTLGSEKIDFKSAQLDASKPILLSSKYNRALQSVIDKDISSLVDKFDSMKEKIRKLLVIHNITQKLENNTVENVEKVLNSLNNIIDIIKMTTSKRPNYTINLPKEYIAKKEYNYIYIGKKKETNNISYNKKIQNINKIDDIIIKLEDNIDTDGNDVCRLNSKDIKLPLYLRNKKNGDYIEVLGLNGKKKVKDIFINSKIPLDLRNNYPLLVDANDNILWIPFIKKSKYNVKKDEFCDIILTSHKEGENLNEEKE
jgi:tRNA(Ile)-lysidine synthetase-like protein